MSGPGGNVANSIDEEDRKVNPEISCDLPIERRLELANESVNARVPPHILEEGNEWERIILEEKSPIYRQSISHKELGLNYRDLRLCLYLLVLIGPLETLI